jgi:hypothetical protein
MIIETEHLVEGYSDYSTGNSTHPLADDQVSLLERGIHI